MSKHKLEKCLLPKPKRKHLGLVAACKICFKLHYCDSRYIQRGGYYFWAEIKGEQK